MRYRLEFRIKVLEHLFAGRPFMYLGYRMLKQVILITGTPCVGKTSVARMLAAKLGGEYINLTDVAIKENLILGRDEKRASLIIDDKNMRKRIREIVEKSEAENVIVDGHYAASVVPEGLVTRVFILRRNPIELRKLMEERGFSGNKLWENLASEILDICLVEAINIHGAEKVCEVDVTGKSVEETVAEILKLLKNPEECHVGIVDWLSELERKGIMEEYLKI